MNSRTTDYTKYFWDLNEKALKDTWHILKDPQHPKFASRMITFLSRSQEPKELFSLISKESFIKAWPKLKLHWKKMEAQSDFRDWWQTIYEQLLDQYGKLRKPKGRPSSAFLNVGKLIKEARIRKGISQKDLALQAGMSQPDISRIEEGSKNITLRTLFFLGKILDIKRMDLV